ncbi:kelch-like protein diablo [Asterias rubens]|uniref:kelch-like protein diablo n=1 Tax=Asterias rubens TaxID=7604 RepID=UPI0014550AB8|nr:kelch-like protein diablo [Asterias rubens]
MRRWKNRKRNAPTQQGNTAQTKNSTTTNQRPNDSVTQLQKGSVSKLQKGSVSKLKKGSVNTKESVSLPQVESLEHDLTSGPSQPNKAPVSNPPKGMVLSEPPELQLKLSTLLEVSHPNVVLPSSDALHSEHVLVAMAALWKKKQLNDVVLAIGPHRIGTHKLILAACSGYFLELFTKDGVGDSDDEFLYTLHGISFETLKLLLEAMYTGHFSVDSSRLEEILSAAVYLKLSFALKICSDFMIGSLNTHTCLRTLGLATVFGLTRVIDKAFEMASRNFSLVADTPDFLELPEKTLMTLISRDDLVVDTELSVFQAMLRWIDVYREVRLDHASLLLENVRLPMIKPPDLVDHVESVEYLMRLPECEALVKEALHYYCLPLRQSIMQSKRTTPRSTVHLTTMVALGGHPRLAKQPVGNVLMYYNSNTNEWRMLSKMIHPRHHHAAAVLGGFLYVAGGREVLNSPDAPLKSGHRYDPRTDSWIQIADMRNARESFQMGVVDGMIYAVGGRMNSDSSLAAVERYNPNTDQWEDRAPLSTPRRCVAVAVHDGKLYAVGGSGNKKISNKVEVYLPRSDTWKTKKDLKSPRFFSHLSSVGDYLYLAGGAEVDPTGGGVRCVPHIQRYDPVKDTWTKLRAMRQPRAEAASCVVGTRIYVIGGYCWDKKSWLRSAECYDVEADEWTDVEDCTNAYTGMACCCLTLHKLP